MVYIAYIKQPRSTPMPRPLAHLSPPSFQHFNWVLYTLRSWFFHVFFFFLLLSEQESRHLKHCMSVLFSVDQQITDTAPHGRGRHFVSISCGEGEDARQTGSSTSPIPYSFTYTPLHTCARTHTHIKTFGRCRSATATAMSRRVFARLSFPCDPSFKKTVT